MTLRDHIIGQITQAGPMSIADFMSLCLMHPTLGYYTTRDPLGTAGDFITAPEISQMFGELIGLSLAQTWQDQGAPARFTLAELGPGRGTLMADILRAARNVPGFAQAAEVHLVEVSQPLRAMQSKLVPQATHHASLATLPDQPLYIIANEFFDALPIRQFQRDGTGWREKVVGLQDSTLSFGLTAPTPFAALAGRTEDTKDGDIVELCPSLPSITTQMATRINAHGGAALIIDYGDWGSQGDTLQALAAHKMVAPLDDPGNADLTAHVDFAAIAANATPATHTRLTPQGVFLERLGITARAQQLAQGLSGQARAAHIAAHRRLTHPNEMGHLFKVLALYPMGGTPPPGCEP